MKYIIALLISMIPLVELRGAVPVAIASGIPWWQALILCVIGNMVTPEKVESNGSYQYHFAPVGRRQRSGRGFQNG